MRISVSRLTKDCSYIGAAALRGRGEYSRGKMEPATGPCPEPVALTALSP